MPKKPSNEVDLSPYVIRHFQDLGYCVHGEVAVFGKSIFIDHVAHRGPCHKPRDIVAIEMKMGATKDLRRQLFKLNSYHVAHRLCGVIVTQPRKSTMQKWARAYRWEVPELLIWHPEGKLQSLRERKIIKKYSRSLRTKNLLLFDANKEVLAGYRSGQTKYLTHWSVTKDLVKDTILSHSGPIREEDLWKAVSTSYSIQPYKHKKGAFKRVLKVLEEEDLLIRKMTSEDKTVFYEKV